MWKKNIAYVVVSVLLLLAAVGCGTGSGQEETGEGAIENTPVEVEEVSRGNLQEHVEISGDIDSDGNVAVVPQVNGTVKKITAGVGDRVESGQVLVELENDDIASQLRQAESGLEQARLQLETAREVHMPRQIDQMESELEQREEDLKQAELSYDEGKRGFERTEELYREGIISQQEFEQAQVEFETMESRLSQARKGYESTKRQLEMERVSQEREITMMEAQLHDAQIGLDSARSAYEKTRLKAPVSGTVSSVLTRLGQEASPGLPLMALIDYDSLFVETGITERQLDVVSEGDPVLIQVPTLGETYPATVREIALAPLEGTRSYPLKAYFDDTVDGVRIGQHANILITAREAADALVVSRSAVLDEEDVFRAFVVEDGIARERILELGLTTEDEVEVVSGLEEGEKLVTRGQQYIGDGEPVDVVGGEDS